MGGRDPEGASQDWTALTAKDSITQRREEEVMGSVGARFYSRTRLSV